MSHRLRMRKRFQFFVSASPVSKSGQSPGKLISAMKQALPLLAALAAGAPHWPRIGIHDGDNKIVWSSGCCDGDVRAARAR